MLDYQSSTATYPDIEEILHFRVYFFSITLLDVRRVAVTLDNIKRVAFPTLHPAQRFVSPTLRDLT